MWWGLQLPYCFWTEPAQSPHSEAFLSESGPACGQSLRCLAAACGTQALGGLRRLSLLGVGGDGPTAHIWGHLR